MKTEQLQVLLQNIDVRTFYKTGIQYSLFWGGGGGVGGGNLQTVTHECTCRIHTSDLEVSMDNICLGLLRGSVPLP